MQFVTLCVTQRSAMRAMFVSGLCPQAIDPTTGSSPVTGTSCNDIFEVSGRAMPPAIAETRYIKSITCRLLPNS